MADALIFTGATFDVVFGLEVLDFDLFFAFLFLCPVLHITFHLFVVCAVSANRAAESCAPGDRVVGSNHL